MADDTPLPTDDPSGDPLERALEAFASYVLTPDYDRTVRAGREMMTQTLAAALQPEALTVSTFRSDLLKAVRQVSRWIDLVTHSSNRDDFESYLSLANRRRLRNLLRSLLYGDAMALAQRIDAFKREVDRDYAELLPGQKHVTLGLISLLLAASQPQRHLLYRQSLIAHAATALGVRAGPNAGSLGEHYAAFLEAMSPVQARMGAILGRPPDWIDIHAFQEFAQGAAGATARRAHHAPVPRAAASVNEDAPTPYVPETIAALRELAAHTRNIILYGPPGTGKTHWSRRFARIFTDPECAEFVTFHQSFGYEEFVEGLRPVAAEGGQLRYRVVDGVFKRICRRAEVDAGRRYLLIVDEINRANIARTFGELITLIEDDKRLGQPAEIRVTLPYSQKTFGVPLNLYLLGTMNTADRSIALLDLALRRRFSFMELAPDPTLLGSVAGVDLGALLSHLNRHIAVLLDRDHQIGHGYLLGAQDIDALRFAWYQRIVPLLQEYFYNAGDRLGAVLGSDFVRPLHLDSATQAALEPFYEPDIQGGRYEIVQLEGQAFSDALRRLAT